MSFKIVITDDRFGSSDEELKVFSGHDVDLVVAHCKTVAEVADACRLADAVLVNQAPFPRAVVERLERCRVVSRYGIGWDNVDTAACAEKGIWVTNVPGYCSEEVAEHALGLLLSCVRGISERDRAIRDGGWNVPIPVRRMSGRVMGIVGFGASGKAFFEKVRGFGFSEILVDDPRAHRKMAIGAHGRPASWEEIVEKSDFISLHLPLKESTRHLVNAESLSRMKDGVIIINTARGGIIEETALLGALTSGKVCRAGLDVFEHEPPCASSELLALPNVILTDHSAYYSEESVAELKRRTADNALRVLLGGIPETPVNAPVFP